MQKRVNYNPIARFYDRLSQLVYGKSIKNAQVESLQYIPASSRILIAGGGTGWILEELARIYPTGFKISYVDSSSKMVSLAKKRNIANNKVEFVTDFIEDISLPFEVYDVIITPFLFSGFNQSTSEYVCKRLNDSLKTQGLWLNTDFRISDESSYWQKLLLKLMFKWFRLVCNIEAKNLPSLKAFFSTYTMVARKTSFYNFIKMEVFQKRISGVRLN